MKLPDLSKSMMHDACLTFRHDYGLMSQEEQEKLQWQCIEWFGAIRAAIEQPSAYDTKEPSDG